MKIFGIGTDIVNIVRMEKSLKQYGSKFKNNIFSKNEITYCEKKKNSGAFYAKRFAAKEALSKALGTGIRKDIKFRNIEICKGVEDLINKTNVTFLVLPTPSQKDGSFSNQYILNVLKKIAKSLKNKRNQKHLIYGMFPNHGHLQEVN